MTKTKPADDRSGRGGRKPPPQFLNKVRTPGFWVLLALFSMLVVAGITIFWPFVGSLLVAAIATTLLHRAYARLLTLIGARHRALASALMCLAFLTLMVVPATWLVVSIASQAGTALRHGAGQLLAALNDMEQQSFARSLFDRHPVLLQNEAVLKQALERIAKTEERPAESESPAPAVAAELPDSRPLDSREEGDRFLQLLQGATKLVSGILVGTVGFLFQLLLVLVFMFFFFKDGPELVAAVRAALPVDHATQEKLVIAFREVSGAMIRGIFLTAIAQGTVAGLAFFVAGVKGALFWGTVTVVCALVPILGTAIVTVPMCVVAALNGAWANAAILGIAALIVATMDNFLRPLLTQSGLKLHPVWILISMLGGVKAFGPLGLVLGPMVVVLIRTFARILFEGEQAGPVPSSGAS
ncbi:MAG: AI-2E family transporter [Planctomycetota bacterium]